MSCKESLCRKVASPSLFGSFVISLVCWVLPCTVESAWADAGSNWTTREIEGWTVNIAKRLQTESPKELDKALGLLTLQLREIVRVVPPKAVESLRKVKLWMSPEYAGVPPRAEYHPGAGWLRENGRDPAMVEGVEFTNVKIFEAESRRMPNFALHELAHAYHHQVLGYDHRALNDAFARARASGVYDRVERQDSEGRKAMDRAYALTSAQEYFAETTEAYFARNDFQPYDRNELQATDPAMCTLLEELWGVTGKVSVK